MFFLFVAATPPPGYAPIPELSDEFDLPELDLSKWSTSRTVIGWDGRPPALFDASNVMVQNGTLQLWARPARRSASWPSGFDNYTTAAVHSLARVREGYFEVRWRSGSSGISSSWWFHQNMGDTWTEIDVFETTGATNGQAKPGNLPSHVHIFDLPNTSSVTLPSRCNCKLNPGERCARGDPLGWPAHQVVDQPPCSAGSMYTLPENNSFASDFHVASLNWTSAGVTVALDGQVVNTIATRCLVQEIGMDFDRETMPGWMALPDPASLPDQPFEIDYVRAWKRL